MDSSDGNMRRVVQRLRAEKNEALLELAEFNNALTEIQSHLESLGRATEEVERAMRNLVLPDRDPRTAQLRALRDETAKVNEMATLILAAYGELRFAVQGWDIEGGNHASN